jgi:hypothetical protein
VTVAALLMVGWVDYITGPRLAFFPFYLCVLVLASLRSPRGAAMLYSALAATIFLVVDLATVPALGATIYPYWRAVAQLTSFSLVTYVIPTLRDERRRLVESEQCLVQQQAELQVLSGRLVAALEEARRSRAVAVEALGRGGWPAPTAPGGIETAAAPGASPSPEGRQSW